MLRTPAARLPRLAFVMALLVLTLVVACALAWQAHRAARSHRDVAERVLSDYVQFASWEFSRASRRELDQAFDRWLGVITCAAQSGGLPEPAALGDGPGCRCNDLSARALFRLDLDRGTLQVSGERLDEDSRQAVLAAIKPAAVRAAIHPPRVVRLTSVGGRLAIVAARGLHRSQGPVFAVAGFVANLEAVVPTLRHVVKDTPLLPPTLAGVGNGMLGVRVRTRTGVPVLSMGIADKAAFASGSLDDSVGAFEYDITLNRAAAGQLVIGGLPQSRLPLLLGLLGLTTGLVIVAALQLRREHELARLRGDFVSSVSHELRTPLAQIRLFSETLLLGRVRSEAEGRRSLEIIQQESRRLTHLVENVLYFARSERGAATIAPVPQRLGEVVSELIEAFAPLARSGRAEIRLDLRDDLVVPIDGGAVRQILLNLLDNAVKYGRADQTILVTIERRGDAALLMVDDEGPGVPAEARQRIWEPYSRLAPAAASAVAGAGIGLAVVRDLATLHGGRCTVEDSPRGGARFVIELPGATPATSAFGARAEASQALA